MNFIRRFSIGLFVIAVILLAIIMGGLRLAIVNIEYFKSEIEFLLAQHASPHLVFTGLSGDLNRFNPILRIENVSITLADRSQPLFIDRLEVEFDFWASLRERAPVVLEIAGKLEKLQLIKDLEGRWWTNEVALGGDSEATALPLFAQVLALVPRYLKLDLNRLVVRDQQTGVVHELKRVKAHIDHQNEQFFVRLSTVLPDELGRGLLLKSIIGPKHSETYLNTSNVQLAPMARLLDLDTWGLQQGALDGEIWINMSEFHINSVMGDLVLKNGRVQVSTDKPSFAVDYHARFNAVNQKTGWMINNKFRRLQIENENVPGFHTQLRLTTANGRRAIDAQIDRLQLVSLPVVAGQWLPAEVSRQLAQSKLHGLVQDVVMHIDLEAPENNLFQGRASGVNSRAFAGYPGISQLNAEFVIADDKLSAKLSGSSVRLDFGDQFRAPIVLDRLSLDAKASLRDERLLLALDRIEASNSDISLAGRLWLEADRNDLPWIFLRARFTDAKGSSVRKYIPVKYLPRATRDWIDRGIIEGHVPAGDLQFHGRLRDPRRHQRDSSGEFFVDFEVEQADIFFYPGWHHAKNGAGRVLFHNAGVEFDLDRVSYGQLDNARARGRIKNFGAAVLELEIDAASDTAEAVRTWIASPVGKPYRNVISNFDGFGGDVNAAIEISLPLGRVERRREVKVLLDFDQASTHSDSWDLQLTEINGRLQISEDSFDAQRIGAKYFGDPVRIDVATEAVSGNALIDAQGWLEAKNAFRWLPENLTRWVTGKSDWRVKLNIANVSAPADQPYLRLSAASQLEKTAINMPQPLGKIARDKMRFSSELEFFPEQIQFTANLGPTVRMRGGLQPDAAKQFQLDSLDVAIATELAAEPGPGLNLYGNIPELYLDQWLAKWESSAGDSPNLLRSIQLKVDRLHAYNRVNDQVDFKLRQEAGVYYGVIDSALVKGSFQVPQQADAKVPVLVELDYLRIDKLAQQADYSTLRPSDLADFRLSSKVLLFHDIRFEDLVVDARVKPNLMQVEKFGLRRDKIGLQASAEWKYDDATDTHLTTVETNMRGGGLGEALAGIGFGNTMRAGELKFSGDFSWPAPLMQFDLMQLAGTAKLRIEDGVLNNVEPGGGRFVGLLSISALPRRLALDFSDILIKGMEFDKISGNYQIDKGVLKTRDTRIDGPAVKIKIVGETGVIERNYNQTIRVTPKIGETLPLVGGALYGSTAGWALLLLKNLFKRPINDAVEVEYKVTGSWDDPQIELIKAVDENQQELPQTDK